MQLANRGLDSMAFRTPWHFRAAVMSGLLSASPVMGVQEAHEYNRAIQVCNTDFYWTLVTSSYCVSYRRLAIQFNFYLCWYVLCHTEPQGFVSGMSWFHIYKIHIYKKICFYRRIRCIVTSTVCYWLLENVYCVGNFSSTITSFKHNLENT